jgi:hypothetical protein
MHVAWCYWVLLNKEIIMNKNIVMKSMKNGAQECGDLTDREVNYVAAFVNVATGATLASLLGTKVVLVGSGVVVLGTLGKAFYRGFTEQYVQMSMK